jgi:hypothetical protein
MKLNKTRLEAARKRCSNDTHGPYERCPDGPCKCQRPRYSPTPVPLPSGHATA